jgi:hypothetical protein
MVTRTRLNKTNAHWLSCQYKERNGYWFCVYRFYMNFTTLRIACHSNVFISCSETGIAQSLQLLSYVLLVLYNRGTRVRFRMRQRIFYTVSRFLCSPPSLQPLGSWGSFHRCKAAATSSLFLHHPVPRLQNVWSHTYITSYGVVLINDRKSYRSLPEKQTILFAVWTMYLT